MKTPLFSLLLLLISCSLFLPKNARAQEGTKITQTTLVKVKLNSVLHISCYGDKKGAIDIMVSGGIPPYTYQWSNGANTQDIAGLAAGEYKVKVVDSYGCPDSLTVEVKQPEKLTISVDSIGDILCYGFNKGRIDVTVKGGVSPYVYSWSDQSSSQDLINAPAGEYALLVTDSKHCQEIVSAVIKQNPLIVRSDEKVQNVECSGDATGKIDVEVTGGVPPYYYKWTTGATIEDLTNLVAGTYTIQVTDSRGCLEAYSTKVSEPNAIIISLEEVRHINCAGDRSGAIDIKVEGGVKPYIYNWNNGLANTQDLAGLAAGEYSLIIEDARNCQKVLTQQINEPEKLIVDISQVKNVTNYGGSDGAIYINAKGGVAPYKFEWSNGAKTKDIANIPSNNYTCRITDGNKCVNSISINIEQPSLLEVEIAKSEHIKCFGKNDGYIDVNVKGGVTPYKYTWSNNESTEDIRNLQAGTYTLTVTDAHGMQKTVKETIEQPSILESNIQLISNNLCFGDHQGTVDINVTGGSPPYTYNWSNGAKTQDLAKVPAGRYIVQVIDKNQCLDSLQITVEESPKLEVTAQEIINLNCFNKPEGAINIDVKGGVTPYKFIWSNGAITRNLTNLKAGQYNLKVIDSKGCEQTLDANISEPPILESSIGEITNVKCKGDSTGLINLKVNGGTSPYMFRWSDGKTSKDNSKVKAGSYTVKITDAKGCTNTLSATVTEPSVLYSNLDKITNIDCYGDLSGSIDVSIGGGVPPYVFSWSNKATTQNLVAVSAGDYELMVNDQNGCRTSLKATIKQNVKLVATLGDVVHVACNGVKSGSAKVSVTGGLEPYSFKWSNGMETKDLQAVLAGNYTLVVSDAKTCMASLNVTINEPQAFEGEITMVNQIKCFGDANGEIQTSFKGGAIPYTFLWNTKQTSKDIEKLKAGEYSLIATDKNGCIKKIDIAIEQPAELELALISTTNNQCAGDKNGAIDIFVKGGVTPYSYEWSNGDTTQDLSKLEAGQYKVRIRDANGCEKSLEASITGPNLLELSVVSTEDVKCFGGNNGKVDIVVKGGKEPYAYSWSNGAITQNIKDLVAGSYTVNVSDANGCKEEISAILKQPEPLVANLADVKHISCNGDSTGAISIDVTGGSQPYKYKWSNGAVTEDIAGLKVGEYSFIITDAHGCSQSIKTTITQPEPLIATIVSTRDVLCNGFKDGNIDISVKGGVTPYIYSWSDGSKDQDLRNIGAGKYNVKIQDANNCNRSLEAIIKEPELLELTIAEIAHIKEYGNKNGSLNIVVKGGKSPYTYSWSNGATTQNINNLVAGDYSVIVKDSYGCRKDLITAIKQPESIEINVDTINHIRCYGERTGYAKVSVKGGVAPYNYSWNNGYTSSELRNVPAGNYLLKITDANNAVKEKEVIIEQPDIFDLKIDSIVHPSCYELNNGLIKTEITGGTTPYMFAWNNGSSTQDLKGLTSGSYSITVTDSRGCSLSDSVSLNKPEPLEAVILHTENIKCFGEHKGRVNLAVKGGTTPYQFSWNHGAKDQNLVNVMAGNYTVKVIDANQCQKIVNVTVNEPPALVAGFATIKNVPCQGEKLGSISTSVTGGTPPYRYNWNNGGLTESIQNLPIGKYSVSIIDSNGCSVSLSTEITEPIKLTGRISNVNNINCFGEKEGSISIDVQGGTPPYKFGWNNGSKDQNLTAIAAGDYNVKVSDNQGCEISLEASVKEPPQLLASIADVKHINCFGDKAGSIDVMVTGGVEPYSYSWSNGSGTQDLLNIGAGEYTLRVKDSKGCANTVSTSVKEPLQLIIENPSLSDNKCSGENAGNVIITIKGGKEPYSYNWSNGSTTRDIQNVPAGQYSLSVTDANGCKKTFAASITEPPVLTKSIDAVNHITCNGESNGSIHISVSGGVAPYSYQWSDGNTTQDLLNVPAGHYSVLIKEGNGCESRLEATITEPTSFISELISVEHNNCYGDKNGSITISAEGGTLPYTFRWNNGESSQNLSNIEAGDYAVLVSDANGCNKTIKTTINEPSKLVLTIDSARNVKCCGDTSGAIFISVSGGVGPYKYLWSHGVTSEDVTGLAEGQYTVAVTDLNGCVVNTPEEGATIYEKIIAQGKFVSRDILFDVNKAIIKESSFIEISRIASFMKEYPDMRFSIEGHTDSQGDDAANMKLSQNRADAVREALIKFGIDASRLETKGRGETMPVDTNTTPEGRTNNRRVEFIPL